MFASAAGFQSWWCPAVRSDKLPVVFSFALLIFFQALSVLAEARCHALPLHLMVPQMAQIGQRGTEVATPRLAAEPNVRSEKSSCGGDKGVAGGLYSVNH